MFIAKIKRFLGFGLLLALALGISTNHLWAAEAAGGSGGGGHGAGDGAGDVNRYAALSQAARQGVRSLLAAALLQAAKKGYLGIVRSLLANGADVNLQAQNGDTALMVVALNGHLEIVRLLLANGANVNLQAQNGGTALMVAALNGHLEIVRLLLANGANVNLQAQNSGTALMAAIYNGHLEVVRLLLANGANVNLQAQSGAALMVAAYKGHLEIVRLLLANGTNVNVQRPDGVTALMMAVSQGHVAVVQLLLAAGAELPAVGRLSAAQNARIQAALAELVERKAEFLAAAATGNLAQINRLIALPIRDRQSVMNQALLALAGSETDIPAADFERILAILLAQGADIEFRDTVETGGFREAKGAAAASVSAASDTALELAIMTNVPNRVDALLMAGANPEKLSESIRVYLANASLAANLAIKEIAKMIENANMARAMLISPAIFKRFTLNIGQDQDNTLDPVLRYLFQWEEQENDRAKRKMLATPLPPDED